MLHTIQQTFTLFVSVYYDARVGLRTNPHIPLQENQNSRIRTCVPGGMGAPLPPVCYHCIMFRKFCRYVLQGTAEQLALKSERLGSNQHSSHQLVSRLKPIRDGD